MQSWKVAGILEAQPPRFQFIYVTSLQDSARSDLQLIYTTKGLQGLCTDRGENKASRFQTGSSINAAQGTH